MHDTKNKETGIEDISLLGLWSSAENEQEEKEKIKNDNVDYVGLLEELATLENIENDKYWLQEVDEDEDSLYGASSYSDSYIGLFDTSENFFAAEEEVGNEEVDDDDDEFLLEGKRRFYSLVKPNVYTDDYSETYSEADE